MFGRMPLKPVVKKPVQKFKKPEVPKAIRVDWENKFAEYLGFPSNWREDENFVHFIECALHRKLVNVLTEKEAE